MRGICADMLPMLMIRPPPWRFMIFIASREHRKTAVRLMSTTSCQSSRGDLVYGTAFEYPRIVDEQVDPSEPLHRLPEQLQHLPLVRQVRLHHEHLRPEAPKLLGGRLQVVPVPGRGGQIGPIPSECSRDPLPDPGARPRNDSYLPFKLSHISSLRGLASTPYL